METTPERPEPQKPSGPALNQPGASTSSPGHGNVPPMGDAVAQQQISRAPWLFQKGNRMNDMRRQRRQRVERLIQEVTLGGATLVAFWVAMFSGQPFMVRRLQRLSMTPEQEAVARGDATDEQKKKAAKQKRWVLLKEPYVPTPEDMKEASNWLSDRGFGKAPQIVQVETGDESSGFKLVFRKWEPGFDPATLPEYGGAKADRPHKKSMILDMSQQIEAKPNGTLVPVKKNGANGHSNGQNGSHK